MSKAFDDYMGGATATEREDERAACDDLIFAGYEVVNRTNGKKAIVTGIGVGGAGHTGIQYADGTRACVPNSSLKLLCEKPNKADYPRVDFSSIAAADAAQFKVGDKVRMKSNALNTVFVIEKITERGTAYLAVKGHESYKEATSLNDLVAVDSAAADAAPKFHVGQIVKPKSIRAGSELRFKVTHVGGRAVYGRNDPLAAKEAGQTMYTIERIGDPYGTGGIGKMGFYAENDLVAVDSAAADAAFLAGERVKFINGELNGKVGEYVRELGIGTHIVKVDGAERRCSSGEFRVYSSALGDAAESACDYDLTGYSKMVRDYLTKASKAAKGRDSVKAAGLIVKAREIMRSVESALSSAKAGSGNEAIIKAAGDFLKKWTPVFARIPSTTKEWNGELGAMPATDAAEGPKSANGKVLRVGSRVCPSSWADKDESKAREVTRIDGEYVYLKGQTGGFLGEWLYAFDGCETEYADIAVGSKVQIVGGSFAGCHGVVRAVNGNIVKVDVGHGGADYSFRTDQVRAYDAAEPLSY